MLWAGSWQTPCRCLKFSIATIIVVVALAGLSTIAIAQRLALEPECGKNGTSTNVSGTDWVLSITTCELRYYYADKHLATHHTTEQPNLGFSVPSTGQTEGKEPVRVEVWEIDPPFNMRECREILFQKLVDDDRDPFRDGSGEVSGISGATDNGSQIQIRFDPEGVCDIVPCDAIRFIQAVRIVGEFPDGSSRVLSWVEDMPWFLKPVAAQLDNSMIGLNEDALNPGWTIDLVEPAILPYYHPPKIGSGPVDPEYASMTDSPWTWQPGTEVTLPGGTHIPAKPVKPVKLFWNFETNVFCARGDGKGNWLGRVDWGSVQDFSNNYRASAQLAVGGYDHDWLPSPHFLAALSKHSLNTGWEQPLPGPEEREEARKCN